jgi:hypothetical protein
MSTGTCPTAATSDATALARNAMKSLVFPLILLFCAALLAACQPTVKVEAPDKPIVINLNVKIEQEVRIKVERDVEELLNNQPDLFE